MRKILLLLVALLMLAAACTANTPATVENAGGSDDAGESAGESAASSDGGFSCAPSGDEPGQFSEPAQVIREGMDYLATITMDRGDEIVLDLDPDAAPVTVNNFVFLACQGFYDGVTFHRVIPGFVAQGGDPTGTGTGGPGYTIAHEADNGLPFDRAGLISMAHTGRPNSTGSQFFITYAPVPNLDPDFTVFGEVVMGMDVVEAITPRDPQANPNAPAGDVIASIRVEEVAAE